MIRAGSAYSPWREGVSEHIRRAFRSGTGQSDSTRLRVRLATCLLVWTGIVSPAFGESGAGELPSACAGVGPESRELPALVGGGGEVDEAGAAPSRDPVDQAAEWNAIAVGRGLQGDFEGAAEAGRRALDLDWRELYLTNLGVHLARLDRLDRAQRLLECAYALGSRSPYLLEALASVLHSAGDPGGARKYITEAALRAPDDAAIAVEAALLTTGRVPEPPPSRPKNAVERAVDELELHYRRTLAQMEVRYEEVTAHEEAAGFAFDERRADLLESFRTAQSSAIEHARSQVAAAGNDDFMWNTALGTMVVSYLSLSQDLLDMPSDYRTDWVFWAELNGMRPRRYARELKRHSEAMDRGVHSDEPLEKLHGRDPGFPDVALLYRVEFESYLEEFDGEAIDSIPCGAWREAFVALEDGGEQQHSRANRRFQPAAMGFAVWVEENVLDARLFAQRTLAARRELGPRFAALKTIDARMTENIDVLYRMLPTRALMFLETQQQWLEMENGFRLDYLESQRERLARCGAPRPRGLDELSTAELEALLAELERKMLEDIKTEIEFKPDCEVSIGGFKIKVDSTGKVTRGYEGVSASTRHSKMVGATVKIGHSVSAGEGIVAKGGISVAAKYDNATNQWDAVVQATGKIGVGVAIPEVGSAACYPGSAKATVSARSFIQHEALYGAVKNRLGR